MNPMQDAAPYQGNSGTVNGREGKRGFLPRPAAMLDQLPPRCAVRPEFSIPTLIAS